MNNVCIIGSYAKALVMTSNRIPLTGETLIGHDYRETYGGKGSDMAVQAARLESNVSYIGVVGDDPFGREFISLMEKEGVDSSAIRTTKDRSTGVGFIIKDNDAQNIIVVDKGANDLFNEADIDANIDKIEKADVVLAQLEIPIKTALYALKRAKELGKTTILNPAPAVDLTSYDLSFVDYITPNETEARVVVNAHPKDNLTNRDVALKLIEKTNCKKVVMTLGGDGVDVHTKEEAKHVDSYHIDVVDSNGAGDSFNASFATALARGQSVVDAIAYANATAGLCCTKWETVPSYHTHSQVLDFIKQQGARYAS